MKKKWNQLTSLLLALVMVLSMALQVPMKAKAAETDASGFKGKVISIMGDSISTYEGWIPEADGFNLEHRKRYPDADIPDVTSVEQTWWHQVITELNANLGVNESWAGSTVTNVSNSNSGDVGPDAAMASLTRIQNLGSNGTPDVILFYGGTNDIGKGRTMGSFSASDKQTTVDLTSKKWDTFAEAYETAIMRMQYYYPNAQILAMLPTYTKTYYTNSELATGNSIMKAICEAHGVAYIDLRNSVTGLSYIADGIHPNAAGMGEIKKAVVAAMQEDLTVSSGTHTVYSISHNLVNATASLDYYKGVDAGSVFEETITPSSGEELTVTVTMGNTDVTSDCYNPATGRISISSVTGNVSITAMGAFGLGEHLQAIPTNVYAETNLWEVLVPEGVYYVDSNKDNLYSTSEWDSYVSSVTVPVTKGDKLFASSFGGKTTNGSGSNNGIRVTYFKADGTLITVQKEDVYTEFDKNGYLTVPDGVVAVNVPMWNGDTNKVFKILTLTNVSDAEMVTSKNATLKDDGTYSIDLSAFSTGNTLKETVVTPVPLDIVFVLDASTSMLYYEVKQHVTTSELSKIQSVKGLSKDSNLWNKLNVDNGYYLADGRWVTTVNGKRDTPVYSITIPVAPGDRIDATSFKDAGSNGSSSTSGIRVTFFDENGALLESWEPSKVNTQYKIDNRNYIVVPDGAYAMCVPMWTNSADHSVKNKDLVGSENSYNPKSNLDLQNMRMTILQRQVDDFASQIYENAKETGADHQLSIVTFGGGIDSTAPNQQGYFYKHVSVNGLEDDYYGTKRPASEVTKTTAGLYGYYYTNTGLFVDGEFKNYYAGKTATAGRTYTPVFDIDQSKTYYYVKYEDENAGKTAKVEYANGKWTDEDGVVVTPMLAPYDSNANVQFLELTIKDVAHLADADYAKALESVVDTATGAMSSKVSKAVDSIVARGGTDTVFGMDMANNVLAQNSADRDNTGVDRKQIVILFTDGDTDNESADIVNYAKQIKAKGAEIYSIGVGDISEKDWLKKVSSDYDANGKLVNSNNVYYKYSQDMDSLESFFTSITDDLTTSTPTTTLDENAVMEDVLADGFVYGEGFTMADISVSTQEISVENGVFSEGTAHTYVCTDSNATSAVFTCNDDAAAEKELTVTYNKSTGKVGVTGFDYSENYVAAEHPGEKLMVTINEISITTDAATDRLIDTNKSTSGINYRNNNTVTSYPFEQPKTQVNSKLYVMDYAAELGLDSTEWNQVQMNAIDAATTEDKILSVNAGVTSLLTKYGVVEKVDNNLLYTPRTMQWDGMDEVYTFGKLTTIPEGVTTGANTWSKVTVVPANSIYYEDDFVTDGNGTVGIVYTKTWKDENGETQTSTWGTEGTTDSNITADAVGTTGNGSVHGWEDALADDTGYSGGSAHKVDFELGETATATFTFKGTGVDIYARTNSSTGKATAQLFKDGESRAFKTLSVDQLAKSGDYYQIPTLFFNNLEYGEYKVVIRVGRGLDRDDKGNVTERTTYYIDGVRVYNPLGNNDSDYAEQEQKAIFTGVRDILLDNGNFNADKPSQVGAVFVDEVPPTGDVGVTVPNEEKQYGIGTYEDYGPKNEAYLSEGQAVVLKVDPNGTYYLGMKSPTGAMLKASVSNGETMKEIELSHASDMYYKVTPTSDGYIVIQNAGKANEGTEVTAGTETASVILSITKLRTTTLQTNGVVDITPDEAVAQVFALRRMPVYEEPAENEEGILPPEEVTEQKPEVDVEIKNPDSDVNTEWQSALQSIVKTIFNSIRNWLKIVRF